MGLKYTSNTIVGYNVSAPPDDGSTGTNNLITWANTKNKIGDPVKTLAESINASLLTALDFSSRSVAINDVATAADNMKTIEVTAGSTFTLPTAATAGPGFIISYKNLSAAGITINLQTATDTIEGVVGGTQTLQVNQSTIFKTNLAATGYYIDSLYLPLTATTAPPFFVKQFFPTY